METGGPDPLPEKSQSYGVPYQYCSGSPIKLQRYQAKNTCWAIIEIEMAFRWWADDGPTFSVI